MSPRTKKPKCAAANKACGLSCKPKAAICADQRKKLVANAKKSGLKGQAAKDYVKGRIDRYKKFVGNKGKLGEAPTATPSGRFAKVERAYEDVMAVHKEISISVDKAKLDLKKMDDLRNAPEYKKLKNEKESYLEKVMYGGLSKEEEVTVYAKYKATKSKLEAIFDTAKYGQISDSVTNSLLDPKVLKAHEELKSALMDSGLSQKEAQQQTEKIKMSAQVRKLRGEHVSEFVRLVGSVPPSLKTIEATRKKRSFASDRGGMIGLNKGDSKNTVYHEMGHHLEYGNPDLKTKAKDWVVSRSTGDLQRLSEITGNKAYANSEIAYPGNFVSPYVGRIYKAGNGEAVSVGIEHFSEPALMAKLYHKDPSHYEFIIEAIKGYQTRG